MATGLDFSGGMVASSATGTISGTPTTTVSAVEYIITATNSEGDTDTVTLSVSIYPSGQGLGTATMTATANGMVVETDTRTVTIGGDTVDIKPSTITATVTTGTAGGEGITTFVAAPISTPKLIRIAEMAMETDGIDFSREANIDATFTPTLVVSTAIDIKVNNGACPAEGCEVTLSYTE